MAYYMLPGLKRLDAHESWLVRVLKRGYGAALARAFAQAIDLGYQYTLRHVGGPRDALMAETPLIGL